MKSYAFLFWAYNVVWLGLAGYVIFIFLRMKRATRRLDNVERELQRQHPESAD